MTLKDTHYIKNYYRIGWFITALIVVNLIAVIYLSNFTNNLDRVSGLGKQRVLTQRIAYITANLATGDIFRSDFQALKDELVDAINLIETDRAAFTKRELSSAIKELYYDAPLNLDEKLFNYLSFARDIVNNYKNVKSSDSAYIYIANTSKSLMDGMDAIITGYSDEYNENVRKAHNLKIGLLTFSFMLLILQSAVIFRPMGRLVISKEAALEKEIEHRYLMEAVIRGREITQRLVMNQLPNFAVLFFDKNLCYQLAEGKFLEKAGYSRMDLVGRSIYQAIPDRAELFSVIFKRVLGGEMVSFDGKSKDGIPYHAELMPVPNEKGDTIGGMILIEDMSNQLHPKYSTNS